MYHCTIGGGGWSGTILAAKYLWGMAYPFTLSQQVLMMLFFIIWQDSANGKSWIMIADGLRTSLGA
jgi:hypothetical protein